MFYFVAETLAGNNPAASLQMYAGSKHKKSQKSHEFSIGTLRNFGGSGVNGWICRFIILTPWLVLSLYG